MDDCSFLDPGLRGDGVHHPCIARAARASHGARLSRWAQAARALGASAAIRELARAHQRASASMPAQARTVEARAQGRAGPGDGPRWVDSRQRSGGIVDEVGGDGASTANAAGYSMGCGTPDPSGAR
jgi:hypothetical protein